MEPDKMSFPECQYVANGLPLKEAEKLGDSYRAGNNLEPIGHEIADRISERLNKINRRSGGNS